MKPAILTLNAGSSSIKFALFENQENIPVTPELSGQIDGIGTAPHIKAVNSRDEVLSNIDIPLSGSRDAQHHAALVFLVDRLHAHESGWRIVAVGHRVVHGGKDYSQPLLLDAAAMAALQKLIPLAPLHQPHNLDGIAAMSAALPGVPQVACFDTAFHRTQPEIAQRFALPRDVTDEGVRRYGFHGLSYEYIADVLPEHLGRKADGKIIVAHLGNGSSMCAMEKRNSIATTMGFTAIDGLMMGTRSGNLDPGVLLYLMKTRNMDSDALTRMLYKESGLLGVSGISPDMRTLLASDQPEAAEAVDLYCYRATREIGSLAAALGGLDALIFTAGIGEHAAPVRAAICHAVRWLGITLDNAANQAGAVRISRPDSRVEVLVLPTNEEWMIARHTADRVSDATR